MTAFQDRLRQALTQSGRTARSISVAAGLSPGTVSELLRDADRSPSVENLRAIAEQLGTSFIWLAEGQLPNTRPPGFSESTVEPWAPKPSGERPDLHVTAAMLIETVAPRARHGAAWRSRIAAPLFGVLQGDLLIVDLKRRSRDGDLVLATVADLNTGTGATVLRKLATPYLISPDPADTTPPLVADGARTVLMGPVVAVVRSDDFAS